MKRFVFLSILIIGLAVFSACKSDPLNSRLVIWYENGSPKITRTDFEVYLDGQLLLKDTLTYTGIADYWDMHECHLRKGFHRLQFKSIQNGVSLDTTFMASDTVQHVFVSFSFDSISEETKALLRKSFTPEEVINEMDRPKSFALYMVKRDHMSVP